VVNRSNYTNVADATQTITGERPDALFIASEALFDSRRVQIISLAARARIPATFRIAITSQLAV